MEIVTLLFIYKCIPFYNVCKCILFCSLCKYTHVPFYCMYNMLRVYKYVPFYYICKIHYILQNLKQGFEKVALYAPQTLKEEHVSLLKQLQKAMHKSDVKKGLFAQLQTSRSESVYKILAKHSSPLMLANSSSDISPIRDYLIQTCNNTKNTRKRRSKV